MTKYLLAMYQPDGDPPPPEILDPIMQALGQINAEMRAAGAWVFAAGLEPQTSVARARDGKVVTTDGPYVESKEHLGGFTIVDVADRGDAEAWVARYAEVTGLPIEVRLLHDRTEA